MSIPSQIRRLWETARKKGWIITQAVGNDKLQGFISGRSRHELFKKSHDFNMKLMGIPFRYSPKNFNAKIKDG